MEGGTVDQTRAQLLHQRLPEGTDKSGIPVGHDGGGHTKVAHDAVQENPCRPRGRDLLCTRREADQLG